MAVIEEWGLKRRRVGVSGIISEAQAQLGFIPHFIHIRVLMPSGHPPLLSTALAPG